MGPVLVFLGIAALVGCLLRGIGELRVRAAARKPDVSEGDLCSIRQANRITSASVLASLLAFAIVALAIVLV